MAFTVGDLIDGHYRVERRFAGGMGFVYIVRDEVVGKRFAIKQLPELQAQNKTLLERFRREASAWLLLEYHPHIVQAHSFHPRPEGPMLILECVDGPSLADLLRTETTLSPLQTVRYARQFCQAMNYAHTRVIPDHGVGVLHRDIKPGNILITRGNQLKVTDFGLAKFGEESKLTAEGQFVGTIAYSSPEQLRGASQATKASDVYSFGAVMYQMLCGHAPFHGNTASELYHAIQNLEPLHLTGICPELDVGLAGVVMRCLDKDSAARFGDFAQLEKALGSFEVLLRDRRDWECRTCGYVSRSRVTKCPVCDSAVELTAPPAKPAAPLAGWNCVCGARVSHAQTICPKCGRSRTSPAPARRDDDVPLPVMADQVVLPSAPDTDRVPKAPQPGDTLLPAPAGAAAALVDAEPVSTPQPRFAAPKHVWKADDKQDCLVELAQRDKLLAWRLEGPSYTLGRDPRMKIRVKDPGVAGYQLFLVRLPIGWLALNRQPDSPVAVNGWTVDQRLLHPGDLLRVGSTWLAFSGPAPAAEPPPPLPGRWPDRVGANVQTVQSGGSAPTRLLIPRPAACTLELPAGVSITTHGAPLRVGTSSLCEVRLQDPSVAPIQALVAWQTDGPHLVNLTGAAVKLAGGPVLGDHLLSDGDLVQVGATPLSVRIDGDPLAPAQLRAAEETSNPRRLAVTAASGPQKGRTAVLPTGQPIVIGRHSECDVAIATDQYMSRRHLQLVARPTSIEAKDLGSRHGFAVGQTKSSGTAVVRLGDVLQVGQTYLLVHYELGVD